MNLTDHQLFTLFYFCLSGKWLSGLCLFQVSTISVHPQSTLHCLAHSHIFTHIHTPVETTAVRGAHSIYWEQFGVQCLDQGHKITVDIYQ